MLTRKRSTVLRDNKRVRSDRSDRSLGSEGDVFDGGDGKDLDEDHDFCDHRCSHMSMIATMKREIGELKMCLERERQHSKEAALERTECRPRELALAELSRSSDLREESHVRLSYELAVCKRDLEDARQALDQAMEDRKAIEDELSKSSSLVEELRERAGPSRKESCRSHPHLDWVGRHYLAVSLPEDRMFKPGEPVTPVGVLQKLFEMRMDEKQAASFSILLENMNNTLSQAEPEWYAKNFGFTKARVNANGYLSTDKVDTEHFAWLLFEYGAQASFIEMLAGLLKVHNSTGKGGVTTLSIRLSRIMYSSNVTLFRNTVSKAAETFLGVYDRARGVRESLGLVTVPVNAGLAQESVDSQRDLNRARTVVLRSVLEGIETPRLAQYGSHQEERLMQDPLNIRSSLSAFMKSRGSEERNCGSSRGRPVGFELPREAGGESSPFVTRRSEHRSSLADRVQSSQILSRDLGGAL